LYNLRLTGNEKISNNQCGANSVFKFSFPIKSNIGTSFEILNQNTFTVLKRHH